MTSTAADDRLSPIDRLEVIAERLSELQRSTLVVTQRAASAAETSRRLRNRPQATCNHAREVEAVQATLHEIEHELDGLRTAMRTRGVIEQAKGMLMLQRHCDADEAFQLLVGLSQTSHRKLVEVAQTLVTTWSAGEHGPA